MTHSLPSGTTMSNATADGASPGYRYVSSSGSPFTSIRPRLSQQVTRSPPTPITRLT